MGKPKYRGYSPLKESKSPEMFAVRLNKQQRAKLDALAYFHNMSGGAVLRYLLEHAVVYVGLDEKDVLYEITTDPELMKYDLEKKEYLDQITREAQMEATLERVKIEHERRLKAQEESWA